jgi:hypothetical protein
MLMPPDDEHVDVVRRRTGRAVITLSPRAVDQHPLDVGQVEVLTDDRLRSEGDLQEPGEWSCCSVAQIRAEEPWHGQGSVLQDPGDHKALRLTLECGQWHVESLRQLGGGVLMLGVKKESGEQCCLVLRPEDWHQRRGMTTHN